MRTQEKETLLTEAVTTSLRAIAAVNLAREFYTEAERREHIDRYEKLQAECKKAFDKWNELPHVVKYNEWVRDDGKEAADQKKMVWEAHQRNANRHSDALGAFEKEHALIVELFLARKDVCRRAT